MWFHWGNRLTPLLRTSQDSNLSLLYDLLFVLVWMNTTGQQQNWEHTFIILQNSHTHNTTHTIPHCSRHTHPYMAVYSHMVDPSQTHTRTFYSNLNQRLSEIIFCWNSWEHLDITRAITADANTLNKDTPQTDEQRVRQFVFLCVFRVFCGCVSRVLLSTALWSAIFLSAGFRGNDEKACWLVNVNLSQIFTDPRHYNYTSRSW